MAKHEFGIMMDTPQPGKRYDKYEPQKYEVVSRVMRKIDYGSGRNLLQGAA